MPPVYTTTNETSHPCCHAWACSPHKAHTSNASRTPLPRPDAPPVRDTPSVAQGYRPAQPRRHCDADPICIETRFCIRLAQNPHRLELPAECAVGCPYLCRVSRENSTLDLRVMPIVMLQVPFLGVVELCHTEPQRYIRHIIVFAKRHDHDLDTRLPCWRLRLRWQWRWRRPRWHPFWLR